MVTFLSRRPQFVRTQAMSQRFLVWLLYLTAASMYAMEKESVDFLTPPDVRAAPNYAGDTESDQIPNPTPINPLPESSSMHDEKLRWLDLDEYRSVQSRPSQDSALTIVVAISGGGLRAANFALGALLALEKYVPYGPNDISNLHNEVDYFSTVSGGGLAAAASIVARIHALESDQPFPLHAFLGREDSTLLANLRQPLRRFLALSMLKPSILLGSPTRADNLQLLLDRTILCPFADQNRCQRLTLGHIFKTDEPPKLPYWFINATDLSTGQIFPFSPERLARIGIDRYWHRTSTRIDKKRKYYDVPLALALRSSMNFPPLVPATKLERHADDDIPFLYLTDGGQSDNLGVVTGTTIFAEEYKRASRDRRRLLIVIDAHRGAPIDKYAQTPRPPNMLQSLFRAGTLPLDAHRFRVQQDYNHADANQLSVLDALSAAGDLAVAYIDLAREDEASSFSTLSIPNGEDQEALICAGGRSTIRSLGIYRTPNSKLKLGGIVCPGPDELGYDNTSRQAKILVFNRQAKDKFVTDLLAKLYEARLSAINSVDFFIDKTVEIYSRAVWQEELDKLSVDFNLSAVKIAVRLQEEDVDRIAFYGDTLANLREEIEKLGEKNAEQGQRNGRSGNGNEDQESGIIDRALAAGKRVVAAGARAIEKATLAFLEVLGFNTEGASDTQVDEGADVGETTASPSSIGATPKIEAPDRENAVALVGILSAIIETANDIEKILKDDIVGEEAIKGVIQKLNDLKEKQIDIFRSLDEKPGKVDRSAYADLTEIYLVLSIPSDLLALLEGHRRELFTKALGEYGAKRTRKFMEDWDAARKHADHRIESYKKSDAYVELARIGDRLQSLGLIDIRRAGDDICGRLMEGVEGARGILSDFPPMIDVSGDDPIVFFRAHPSHRDRRILSGRLEEARFKTHAFADTIEQIMCLFPNTNLRDEMTYDQFRSDESPFVVDADCQSRFLYERACVAEGDEASNDQD